MPNFEFALSNTPLYIIILATAAVLVLLVALYAYSHAAGVAGLADITPGMP